MCWIALKMLFGDRSKFLGLTFGVAFASLLMAQQSAIFCGVMRNTTCQILDICDADIWVMSPAALSIDDTRPLADRELMRVRGVSGVAWTARLHKSICQASIGKDTCRQILLLGVDDATLAGSPRELLVGSAAALRRPEAVVIDKIGYRNMWPGAPLETGKTFEINDRRAVVAGICETSGTFITYPVIYTRFSEAARYLPPGLKPLTFVLARAEAGASPREVCARISRRTGLLALTWDDFAWKTVVYYLRNTGIPINFGITVGLGFVVGIAIAGQTFYLFTRENLAQFGLLKAVGVGNGSIRLMILTQGLTVGALGYGIGVGLAAVYGDLIPIGITHLPPAFFMSWHTLALTAAAVAIILVAATHVAAQRVLKLEPAIVYRG
jgi:putative ABC transport system permease protein